MNKEEKQRFAADVMTGLAGSPPSIPCKYLYDETGSELFEAICQTEDYYVTRADLALHASHIDEIAARIGSNAHIIELGSGAGIKIRSLLEAVDSPRAYSPIEISREALATSVAQLSEQFPRLEIRPLQADYTQPIPNEELQLDPPASRRVVYFPGSTISNFTHAEALRFLRRIRQMAGPGGGALIGVDLVKSPERLEKAYDDSDGVTAAFNKNLLTRLATDLDAELDAQAFEHRAVYNPSLQRIEMHLVATQNTRIRILNKAFDFQAGDHIHTENSHKYSIESFGEVARGAGMTIVQTWTDPENLFSMHYLESA
ncbi:MAG: L-histidine N(alpha)-methyltransferase [Wenzhouxiangellaceae bacterium]|nr:L-histidine N(alpha)-methyltransferase [Wenzhouxiangellaceae bacterium]